MGLEALLFVKDESDARSYISGNFFFVLTFFKKKKKKQANAFRETQISARPSYNLLIGIRCFLREPFGFPESRTFLK